MEVFPAEIDVRVQGIGLDFSEPPVITIAQQALCQQDILFGFELCRG
jgi:hypothetical protein